nr:TonB family protein [Gammaproteobacteria bacterium]
MMAPDSSARDRETKESGGFLCALVLLAGFAVAAAAHGSWSTTTAVDELTDEPLIIASAYAHQSESGNPKRKAIHVRCRNGMIDVYVAWGHAIDEDYGMQAHFDERRTPIDLPIAEAADRATAVIQVSAEERQRFLGLMKKSTTLAVRLYDWPGQPVQAKFSLAGSSKAIGKVEHFCSQVQHERRRAIAKETARYEADYKAAIRTAVRRNWVPPAGTPEQVKCDVRVTKFPDGEVITAAVLNSCGSPALDGSVIEAVYQASPFPKPKDPSLFAQELTFEFSSR